MNAKRKTPREIFALGAEAVVEGALLAGCSFYGGYPITPSSEIMESMAARLPKSETGVFIQMEDEIASIGTVIGASMAGRKAMTATSGPGFSLMQELIGYACMTEVPMVIVNVMRGGPSTGLPTSPAQGDVQQARWGTHGDHPIIALAPQSVRETFDLTVRAFDLTERYRIPVILLLDEIVGHISEKVHLPSAGEIEVRARPAPSEPPGEYLPYRHTESDVPEMASFGTGYRFHVTGLCHDETGFPTNDGAEIDRLLRRINRKMERYRDDIMDVEQVDVDDAEVGIFAYGSTARSARRAVLLAREKGIRAGLLRPRVLWPFADKEARALADRVDTIVVPEMNLGQMAHEVEWAAAGKARVAKVNRIDGEPISPMQILETIEEVMR